MREIAFSTTADLSSMEEIARVMTAIWSKVEYQSDLPPEVETADSYAEFCRACNIDLAHSLSARTESGQVVGLAMLGIRGERGWCGDFGVVPEWRGKGIGQRLMTAFVQGARSLGLRSLLLDVRQENTPAIKIYEQAGFRTRRIVAGLLADPKDLRLSSTAALAKPVQPWMIREWYGKPFSPPPMWQRELPALLAADHTQGWVAHRQEKDQAFMLYRFSFKSSGANMLYIGLGPEAQPQDLQAILASALAQDHEANKIFGGLLPESSQTIKWLMGLGFRIHALYREMLLDLQPADKGE